MVRLLPRDLNVMNLNLGKGLCFCGGKPICIYLPPNPTVLCTLSISYIIVELI